MKNEYRFLGLAVLSLIFLSWNVFSNDLLTFESRVKAQKAIEQVYYNNRIWPKENPQSKPSFESIISDEQLEEKVSAYLKKSAALDEFWHRPITGKQLQSEMDRMAMGTKDPQVLNELFDALNNDPYLIAECLARPILADRLLRNWYANDERFHLETKEIAEEALNTLTPTTFCQLPHSEHYKVIYKLQSDGEHLEQYTDVIENERFLPKDDFLGEYMEAPEEGEISKILETNEAFVIKHTLHKSEVEIQIEILVFKKESMDNWLADQVIEASSGEQPSFYEDYYLPSISETGCTEYWSPTSTGANGPSARMNQASVWTGSEMIIWGGWDGATSVNTGGRYNPATDTWVATSTGANVPLGRDYPRGVWTGTEMIVWGGHTSSFLNSGGRYNPLTNSWTATSTGTNVPEVRTYHVAIWTGTEMIVWGGENGSSSHYYFLNTGGRYNPSTNTWLPTSMGANVPTGRYFPSAVWTGTEMIVWDGGNTPNLWNTGGRYNPVTDSWIPTSTGTNVPQGRRNHTAIWTGSEMIIWGGTIESTFFNSGGRYNPATDTWVATSTGANCPAAREFNTAIWTGSKMVIWGGGNRSVYFNDGGIYSPSSNSWTATGANAPSVRNGHTAEWTGTEMIVWGGQNSGGVLNSGGRYNPNTNTWIPTSTTSNSPAARNTHTAVWTGTEMIIWGGEASNGKLNSGGRYNLSTDSWTSTSTGTNVPPGVSDHSAIWTGTEMIVWGGWGGNNSWFNLGGRYNPLTDSWVPTSTGTNVPEARYAHTAIWTGTEMIIWGGSNGSVYFNSGGRYNPTTNSWIPTSTGTNVPSVRRVHAAGFTGSEMIIWGGFNGSNALNTGGKYNLGSDTWTPTSLTNAPSIRYWGDKYAIWTGDEMLIWGGFNGSSALNTGGRYNPVNDTWTPTSITNAPPIRYWHKPVWAGEEMIVWGGYNGTSALNSGGIYNPSTNAWIPTSTGTNVPEARYAHTAIWCGTGMIVWGGHVGSGWLNTGGIYHPPCSCYLTCTANVPATGGVNSAVVFTSSASSTPSGCTTPSFNWDFGNGFSSTQQNPTYTYTASGTYYWTLVVNGTGVSSCTKNGSITISSTCPAITVFPSSLPAGTIGVNYNEAITASGGKTPYSYSITSGTLPSSLCLTPSGSITGIPSEGGSFSFTIMATDADGCTGNKVYTIEVTSIEPPTITFVQKLGNPFRLKVIGSNFHPDAEVYIGTDENPWTNIKYKNPSEIILKGGTALKNRFPKGIPVEIKVINEDEGSASYMYTR